MQTIPMSELWPTTNLSLKHSYLMTERQVVSLCRRPDNKTPEQAPDDRLQKIKHCRRIVARDMGAAEVGLVAPYLAYMRQDRRFRPGEAITSIYFAQTLCRWINWLVTIDPHLHRRGSLSEIYSIPTAALQAAPSISSWISETIRNPVIVGPDSESEQWVAAVADDAGAPFTVLEKTRRGDRDVDVSVPQVELWQDRTPVLVDDIISTARTMIETVEHLKVAGLAPPVCIGVHAVFADEVYEALQAATTGQVLTCNTIPHASNAIDLTELLADGIKSFST